MDISSHKFGGTFRVDASEQERGVILGAIAELGIQGIDPRELSLHPELNATIVSAVAEAIEWNREVLEAVDATLAAPSQSQDAKVLAGRAVLKQQTTAALQNSPRR